MMRLLLFSAVATLSCASYPRQVQPSSDRGVLFMRLGPDTLFVERFERTPERLYVESVIRIPRVQFRTFDARLNTDGSFASISVASVDPANPRGSEARDSSIVTVLPDSTRYVLGLGAGKRTLTFPGRGDFIISFAGGYTFANYELLAARAPRAVGDSIVGTHTSGLGSYPLVVKRVAPGIVTVWTPLAGLMRVHLDGNGRTIGLDGSGSSLGYIGARSDWINIDSVSRAFAELERAQGPYGSLSARDTARATIAGANITVDYGRPTKRGRVIFGNVVEWNKVWRTGANLATHFTTDRALDFGGRVVPAGTYTLFTLPTPTGWTLMINSQIGQWGTFHDPGRDVARIPLIILRAEAPLERFTISIVPSGAGGKLLLAWDDLIADAAFTVR